MSTMATGPPTQRRRFGPFELDPSVGELWRDGRRIRIQEQPLRMLAVLLERPGEVVTREELRARLWPDGTFVDFDHSLNTAVKKVRQALDDSPEAPRYVETVAKRGYRFIAPVEALAEEPFVEKTPSRARRWGLIVAAGAAAVVAVVLWARTPARPRVRPTAGDASLAVLPLANLSGEPQDEYIAAGFTESLITELAKVPGLLVISRNGVLPYAGRAADVKRVASELRVGHVLEGSVQRSNGRLRVTAQLIDAASGFHVWAEKYDRPSEDLFAVQDEIAGRVREALSLSLRPGGSGGMPTASLDAYDAYLRGRFHLHEAGRAADARARGEAHAAITFLEKAVALDPRFAAAHAALGNAYATLFFHFEPDRRWEEQAHVAIEKALAIDAGMAEAYLARALLAWTLANGFPHEQAIEDAKRAVALDPSLTEGRWMIARVYEHVGLLDEALAELDVARRLAPHDLYLDARQGRIDLYLQRYEEALAFFKKIPEADVDDELALANLYLGREREALAMAQDAARRNPRRSSARSAEALALARLGDQSGALRAVAETIRLGQGLGHFHHDEHQIAAVHALAGRKIEAVAWLRRAADHGFPCYPCFATDPDLAGLKGDPGFEAFLSELHGRLDGYRALAARAADTSTTQR
jgi:TolB-like protein/DNA-binding winged helix-turn-helix (wHTH) protein